MFVLVDLTLMLDDRCSISDKLLGVLIAAIVSQNRGFLKKPELLNVIVVKVEIFLESAHLMHVIKRLLRLSSLHGFETFFLQIFDFLVLSSRWFQVEWANGYEWFIGLLGIDFTFDRFLHLADCSDLGL